MPKRERLRGYDMESAKRKVRVGLKVRRQWIQAHIAELSLIPRIEYPRSKSVERMRRLMRKMKRAVETDSSPLSTSSDEYGAVVSVCDTAQECDNVDVVVELLYEIVLDINDKLDVLYQR